MTRKRNVIVAGFAVLAAVAADHRADAGQPLFGVGGQPP